MNQSILSSWEDTKKKVFEGMGQPSLASIDYSSFSEYESNIFDQPNNYDKRFDQTGNQKFIFASQKGNILSNPRLESYTKTIRNFNSDRLSYNQVELASQLSKPALPSNTTTGDKQMSKCWDLIKSIIGNDSSQPNSKVDLSGDGLAADKRQSLVDSARNFLEDSYLSYIDRVIEQNPREAAIGGIPSIHNKIRGFLQIKFSKNYNVPDFVEVYENEAVWAHMYFLLRCGKLSEMLEYAIGIEDVLADSDLYFISYLKQYVETPNHILDPYNNERISASVGLMRVNSRSFDPYKFSIYKVLGRCDLTRKSLPEVVQTTEDYLWNQLVMIREAGIKQNKPAGSLSYTLSDFQALLNKFGQRHFDRDGTNPILYFTVLLCSLQFELAIDFLLLHEVYFVDAVHFTIALANSGLLNIVDPDSRTSGPSYVMYLEFQPQLDFNRLILDYSSSYPEQMKIDTINYSFLLNLPSLFSQLPSDESSISQQKQLCIDFIVNTLYEFRDYNLFLGDVLRDGTKQKGFLDKNSSLLGMDSGDKAVRLITKRLADKSRDDGRLSDSVMLYNLSGYYNTVLQVLSKQIGNDLFSMLHGRVNLQTQPKNSSSQVLPEMKKTSSSIQNLEVSPDFIETQEILSMILEHYANHEQIASKISSASVSTSQTLLILLDFAKEYYQSFYEQALETISRAKLFPITSLVSAFQNNTFNANQLDETSDLDTTLVAANMAENLRDLDESILKSFPDILLATMDTISKLYSGLASSPLNDMSYNKIKSTVNDSNGINAIPGKGYGSDLNAAFNGSKQSSLLCLKSMSKALVVFAGMCQFRMPPDVYAKLNRIDTNIN
ncbi:Meiotically up-regulated gene 87 protein [Smittium culicis]|uniref:Nuclear pore protein n=1 Tax=Smittium culicis TaxID=133412 RepID=A0A1R1YFX1_9FUNG|nr:Meiotically up-regulated gene 87 protein [Smittium culicis]